MNPTRLLETLVNTPSVSGEEALLADVLSAVLKSEGFEAQRTGNSVWFTLLRTDGPHLLFVSHIDTVAPCDGWETDPLQLQRSGQKMIGLGANDAKGCVAAMTAAACELQTEEFDGSITFAFVEKEETGGDGIRAVRDQLGPIDAAVVGEPTALEICTAQRGMLLLRCTARGVSAHVGHGQLGTNAIHQAARDIARLTAMEFEAHHSLGCVRPQVTMINGGLARNQVPDACEFFVDLRTTPNLEHEALAREIASTLESEVAVHSKRYLPVATDENEPIVQAALSVAGKERGIGSVTTSDWAFLKGIPAVKVGPGETERSHRPNEFVLVSELEAGAAFYARLARTYFEMMEPAHV